MEKEQAILIIERALDEATKRGAYSLSDIVAILNALNTIKNN
jgi:hypothetical protein